MADSTPTYLSLDPVDIPPPEDPAPIVDPADEPVEGGGPLATDGAAQALADIAEEA